MRALSILALTLLAVVLTLPAGATTGRSPMPSTAAQSPVVQYQHDVAIPEQIFGVWVHVRGAPGTSYAIYVREGGTSVLVAQGIVPPGGSITTAFVMPHDPVRQTYTRGQVWSVADGRVGALVRFFD
ncbi:MAG: hypothetical protein GY711_17270 [bacterium]|nr:hypothetical protein [bacterium]